MVLEAEISVVEVLFATVVIAFKLPHLTKQGIQTHASIHISVKLLIHVCTFPCDCVSVLSSM